MICVHCEIDEVISINSLDLNPSLNHPHRTQSTHAIPIPSTQPYMIYLPQLYNIVWSDVLLLDSDILIIIHPTP